MPERTCRMCGETKPLALFVRDKSRRLGYQHKCRECDKAASKRYYASNREARLDYHRQKHGAPLPPSARLCVGCGEEFTPALNRQRYCSVVCQQRHLSYQNRRIRAFCLDKVAGEVSDNDHGSFMKHIRADPCAYCGEPSTVLDHIVPKRDSGPNHWTNYTPACRRCNGDKGAHSLLLYLHARPLITTYRQARAELEALGGLNGTKAPAPGGGGVPARAPVS